MWYFIHFTFWKNYQARQIFLNSNLARATVWVERHSISFELATSKTNYKTRLTTTTISTQQPHMRLTCKCRFAPPLFPHLLKSGAEVITTCTSSSSQRVWITMHYHLYISMYLFILGYTNFSHYWSTGDFSLTRAFSVSRSIDRSCLFASPLQRCCVWIVFIYQQNCALIFENVTFSTVSHYIKTLLHFWAQHLDSQWVEKGLVLRTISVQVYWHNQDIITITCGCCWCCWCWWHHQRVIRKYII